MLIWYKLTKQKLMTKRTIVAMPGDGRGKVVLNETIRILNSAGFEADDVEGDIGWEFWCREGNPLPTRTVELLKKHKLGLFGAITSTPKHEATDGLATCWQNHGLVYRSEVVGVS